MINLYWHKNYTHKPYESLEFVYHFVIIYVVGSNYRKNWPYLEKIATETFVIFSSCMGP